MRFSQRLLKSLCISALLIPTIVGAQQISNDFRQRYGPPDNKGGFTVRPNITAYVSYLSDGRVSRILIEPHALEEREDSLVRNIGAELAVEIIDELSPIDRRGALVNSITFSAGCTSISVDDYERVRISRVLTCTLKGAIKSAEIVPKYSKPSQ